MNAHRLLTFLTFCLLAAAPARPACAAEPTAPAPTFPELRNELRLRFLHDQEARFALIGSPEDREIQRRLAAIDSENLARMRDLVGRFGWPTPEIVGQDGVTWAWLLVQHADADPAFQRRCLELLRPLLARGAVRKQDFALLTDRVLVNEQKKQIYGSQFFLNEKGEFVPRPIEDEASVDDRRREMGLPPMAEYRRILEEFYGKRKP